jgi:outer membrane lipoprotein-sorting protein
VKAQRLALRASSALACLLLSACALSGFAPAFRPIDGEDEAMRALVLRAIGDADARKTLRAVGKLRVAGPGGSGNIKQVILVERPARLRLESLNVLGQAATLLVTDGERYAFFDGKTLADGEVSAEVLHDRLGLAFAPAEAAGALLVTPKPVDWPPRAILARGAEREVLFADQSLRFGDDGELAGIESLDASGAVRWTAEYAAWRDVPGGRYPFNVVLSFPATQLRAELELSAVELNPQLEASLFRVADGAIP